jgi:hypothetical protein
MALVVFGELFHAVWRVIGSDFCCSVILIGPESNAANYIFRFAILRNKGQKLSCYFGTQSYIEDVDDVIKPEKCVTIKYHRVEEFLTEENCLPFELEFWKFM